MTNKHRIIQYRLPLSKCEKALQKAQKAGYKSEHLYARAVLEEALDEGDTDALKEEINALQKSVRVLSKKLDDMSNINSRVLEIEKKMEQQISQMQKAMITVLEISLQGRGYKTEQIRNYVNRL